MGLMDEFEALVTSIGENAVAYIGKDHLAKLYVFADAVDMSAFVEIYLEDSTWEEQQRAIDKMIELREMFFDDASIEYRFAELDGNTVEAAVARRPAFALA